MSTSAWTSVRTVLHAPGRPPAAPCSPTPNSSAPHLDLQLPCDKRRQASNCSRGYTPITPKCLNETAQPFQFERVFSSESLSPFCSHSNLSTQTRPRQEQLFCVIARCAYSSSLLGGMITRMREKQCDTHDMHACMHADANMHFAMSQAGQHMHSMHVAPVRLAPHPSHRLPAPNRRRITLFHFYSSTSRTSWGQGRRCVREAREPGKAGAFIRQKGVAGLGSQVGQR